MKAFTPTPWSWAVLGALALGMTASACSHNTSREETRTEPLRHAAPEPPRETSIPEPPSAPARVSAPQGAAPLVAEDQREPLEVLSVVSVDGRLFALSSRPQSAAPTALSAKRRVTLALPGGGALSVTPRKSGDGELREGAWTVVAEDGTCLAEPGSSAELSVDTGSPEGGAPERIAAVELVGCAASIDTTDTALALSGTHPEARLESLAAAPCNEVAAARLPALLNASETDGFDPEAVVSTDDGSLVLYRSAGDDTALRVISVRGTDTSLVLEQMGLPLWLGGSGGEPPGC